MLRISSLIFNSVDHTVGAFRHVALSDSCLIALILLVVFVAWPARALNVCWVLRLKSPACIRFVLNFAKIPPWTDYYSYHKHNIKQWKDPKCSCRVWKTYIDWIGIHINKTNRQFTSLLLSFIILFFFFRYKLVLVTIIFFDVK